MNFIALKMLTGEQSKYLGLVFAIAFCTFLLENQLSIFAGILQRMGSQILDVTDAERSRSLTNSVSTADATVTGPSRKASSPSIKLSAAVGKSSNLQMHERSRHQR